METTNERVRFIRERAGLSQRRLSELAGLATAHVGLIESGHVTTPDLKTVRAIAKALQVEPAWVLLGAGPMIATRPELDAEFDGHQAEIESYLRQIVNPENAEEAMAPPRSCPVVVREGFDQRTGTEG